MKCLEKARGLFIPSIADILFLTIFLYLSLFAGKTLLGDGDTGYHIRAGEYIIETLSVPTRDIFSYRTPPLQWTAHEWLSEVVMALIHKISGLTGVVLFFSFLIAFTYYIFFRIIRRQGGNILLCIVVFILVITSSQIHWLARPHIFSLFLLVVWYHILDEYQYRGKNYLYLLPVIMLPWVNLHGGYIVGLLLLGMYLAGNLMLTIFSCDTEQRHCRSKLRPLGLATLATLLITLFNPKGYQILLFPFKTVSNRFLMDHIIEFLPPNFHEPLPYKYMLLFMIAVFAFSRRTITVIELFLVLLFTSMSLYSARYIPLFGVVVAPILVRLAGPLLEEWRGRLAEFIQRRSERITSVDSSAKGYLWPLAAVLMVVFLLANGRIQHTFDEKKAAVDAVEFLKKEHLHGNMFNDDEFGDYVIYAAWPAYKVFFDGRSDMYGTENIKEYFKITRLEPGWAEVLRKYDINWIFYGNGSTLSEFLLQRSDWKLIYADKVANIFVRNIPANQCLIEKYRDVKPVPVKKAGDA